MDSATFIQKFNSLPDELKKEVSDFVEFLLKKKKIPEKKSEKKAPVFGSAKGMFKMAPDFDEPLEDFKEYMYP